MSDQKIDWESLTDLSENEIEVKAKEIISKMTLRQKAYQMSGDKPIILGLIDLGGKYNDKPIVAGEDKNLGIPGVKFSDGPRGCVMGHSTCFPVSMARGASWDPELEERIGDVIGIEAKSQGANYYGGVCINLLRHPAWGRAQETYGEDPYHLGVMGSALMRGVQKHIMACAKHYACNSMENARFKINVKIDERTLREIYLPHFKMCVDDGLASIMNAYNKVNGPYCGHNSHLLRDILKEDWGFKGFVLTDFILGVRNGKLAINAGVDVEMPVAWRMNPKLISRVVRKGKVPLEYVEDSVLRLLRQRLRFNKKTDPQLYNMDKVVCEEHVRLTLESARKCMVLLKNDDNTLPLDKGKTKKIAVIGRLAEYANLGDNGSSRVYPPSVVTPLEGIKKIAGGSIEIAYNSGKDVESAKQTAREADVAIIVVGYTHKDEGEYLFARGGDRDSLRLRSSDEKLISAIAVENKNCIVVVEGGSAIIMEAWKAQVSAILMAWYPGMEGGTALGEILFGITNPSGKLPFAIPKSEEELTFFDKNAREIEYSYYHGYRLLEKNGIEPAFPFGFGLSYNTYSYNNFKIDKSNAKEGELIKISIDLSNAGKVTGDDIVQLYIGYKKSSVDRPLKDLKGFKRVSLKPGETKTVSIELNTKNLAYYDQEKNGWVVEKIEYIAYCGASSRTEDLLQGTFKIS